jgi:RNA polymerase sigma factor (sigma-70 family)
MSDERGRRRTTDGSIRLPVGSDVWNAIESTVRRIVRRAVRHTERDEMAQQIFLQILEKFSEVRDPDRVEGWAARVATNMVWNSYRKRKRWQRLVVATEDGELEGFADNIDFEARERIAMAFSVWPKLSAQHRDLLEEHWLDEHGVTQIAARHRCSPSTAKRRLRAAQRRFDLLIGASFRGALSQIRRG